MAVALHGTVTLLFTDIEGSTLLWEEQPADMRSALVTHDRLIREVAESVAEIGGELVYGEPKTYERRTVPMPATLAEEMADHLHTRPPDRDAFVFTAPNDGPLRHGNFYRRSFKPAARRAGLERVRFHDLRHTAAALMIAEGGHLLPIKERLGHSTIQVTADRYGHLFPSIEAALTDRLDASYRAALATETRSLVAHSSREAELSTD